MAYTKILVVHNRLDKSVAYAQDAEKTSLEDVIDYAFNRDKTERTYFETAINCDRETAYADMLATKRRWGKEGRRRKGYHIIQSFAPGEVTPEEAHAVGVELAQRLLGDRYEAIVATHLNKAHLHSHIVFNSVSFVDGSMYQDTFQNYYGEDGIGIRGTSDAICQEHGLSVIEPDTPLHGPINRGEWEAEQSGKATLRGLVRQDIDAALSAAYTMKTFWLELARMGYEIKRGPRVTHTAVKPPGGQRFLRLDSLGAGYTEQDLQERLTDAQSGHAPQINRDPPPLAAPLSIPGRRYHPQSPLPKRAQHWTGLRALYFKYLCLLRGHPRRISNRKRPLVSRTEIIKFDRYQEQFRYLMKNRIETMEQLAMQYDALQADIDAWSNRRRELYQIRRTETGGEAVTEEIIQITCHLRALRRELRLCARIENTAPQVRAHLGAAHLPGQARSKAHEKTYQGRPGRRPEPGACVLPGVGTVR